MTLVNNKYTEMYLKQKLQKVKKRKKALDMMEDKLKQMRKLAVHVRDNNPGSEECQRINETFLKLKSEVEDLDEYSKFNSSRIKRELPKIAKRLERNLGEEK